jgi:hypothetical protein
MQMIILIGNAGLGGPIPWDSLSVRFRSNQTSENREISPLKESSQVFELTRMTHLILANNNFSGRAFPAPGGAGDEAFAEQWKFTVAENGTGTNSGNASNIITKFNRCTVKVFAVSDNPQLDGEIHPGIVNCKDLVSLYLHGTGISGNIPAGICGNCYFGVMTLHNIPAFAGDNDTQVAKRRTFRRDCSRAKTEAYATCVREYKKYDESRENKLAPFMITRITDYDGTWDCGGNLSTNVSRSTPYISDAEYDGCVFNPKQLHANLNLPPAYEVPENDTSFARGPENYMGFWPNPNGKYNYPMIPRN